MGGEAVGILGLTARDVLVWPVSRGRFTGHFLVARGSGPRPPGSGKVVEVARVATNITTCEEIGMTTHACHAEDHPYRGHLPGRARRWQTLEGLAVPIELQPAARQAPGCQRLDASGGAAGLPATPTPIP